MKQKAYFRFHGSLSFFLEGDGDSVEYQFNVSPGVKDAIEAIGVPHPEVGFIITGDQPVDFCYIIKDGERIEVYPHDALPPVDEDSRLPFMPEGRPSFVLDVHLGRLARYLRVAGLDTLYQPTDIGDEQIAKIAQTEDRIVLTMDKGLLKRTIINYGHHVRSRQSRLQLREVVRYYSLKSFFLPFSRCANCNGLIEPVGKEKVVDSLPAGIRRDFDEFNICLECGQVYWRGSHYSRISELLESM